MIVDGNTYCKIASFGPILPPEYQEVEYIQSSGTQYIDTGFFCNQDTGIIADIQQVSYDGNWRVWIGSLQTTSDGNWVHLGQASRDKGLRFSWGAGAGTYVYTSISSSDFNRHTYQIDKGELTIDNTTTYTLTNSYEFTTSPSTIVLFADKKGSTITEYSSIKIFYCKLYDNNVLIRNLIPCYRKSNNEIGMYDTVNGVFYTNQGTGTFLKGNNVVHTIRYKIPCEQTVYHIRGTATADFDFTLKYIDRNNNITTVTEHAVIDENGKWDVSYSGKKIKELYNSFNDNLLLTNIEFTEKLNELTSLYGTFRHCYNCVSIVFAKGTTLPKCTTINRCFCVLNSCESVLNTDGFILQNCNDFTYGFDTCKKIKYFDFSNCVGNPTGNLYSSFFYNWPELETLHLDNFNVGNYNINADMYAFRNCSKLVNLYLPQNSTQKYSFSLQYSPLSYDSMLRVAGWLKDLSGSTAQTVTFKASTYNALTAEQKATLQNIIVTQKGWNLATA